MSGRLVQRHQRFLPPPSPRWLTNRMIRSVKGSKIHLACWMAFTQVFLCSSVTKTRAWQNTFSGTVSSLLCAEKAPGPLTLPPEIHPVKWGCLAASSMEDHSSFSIISDLGPHSCSGPSHSGNNLHCRCAQEDLRSQSFHQVLLLKEHWRGGQILKLLQSVK